MDDKAFFDHVRANILHGHITADQVFGLNFLNENLEKEPFSRQMRAYMLATVAHETAYTFQPIKEYEPEKRAYYQVAGPYKQRYYGRGYVQITWISNYSKFDKLLSENYVGDAGIHARGTLLKNPDLALEPDIAFFIMSVGMRDGLFTGAKLATFFHDADHGGYVADWPGARRIINGQDKAIEIAAIAMKFDQALKLREGIK